MQRRPQRRGEDGVAGARRRLGQSRAGPGRRRRVLLCGDTLFGGFSADIGSDADDWRRSLARLADAALDLDALSFGHGVSRLLEDPAGRIAEARLRFASYFDPWFKPPRHTFRY